jgi:hypothetical protein
MAADGPVGMRVEELAFEQLVSFQASSSEITLKAKGVPGIRSGKSNRLRVRKALRREKGKKKGVYLEAQLRCSGMSTVESGMLYFKPSAKAIRAVNAKRWKKKVAKKLLKALS